ncbi:MAG TPA: hypothetical protein VEA63_08630, partial [Opitutus sp.]|nr:hypothetical protein [Opitutus sp.]
GKCRAAGVAVGGQAGELRGGGGLRRKIQFNHEWTRIDTNEIEFGCRIGSEHQTVMHTIGPKAFLCLL